MLQEEEKNCTNEDTQIWCFSPKFWKNMLKYYIASLFHVFRILVTVSQQKFHSFWRINFHQYLPIPCCMSVQSNSFWIFIHTLWKLLTNSVIMLGNFHKVLTISHASLMVKFVSTYIIYLSPAQFCMSYYLMVHLHTS